MKTIYFRSILGYLFLIGSLFGQTPDNEDVRRRALAFTTRLESLPAGKLHGQVEGRSNEAEFWFEFRGEAVCCERIAVDGETPEAREEKRKKIERIIKIAGSGSRSIDSFERNTVFVYLPAQLEARIDDKPYIQFDNTIQAIIPKNWACFNNSNREPFLRFSYLLQKDAKNVKVTWNETSKVVRFTQDSDVSASDPLRAYATRYIDVDPDTAAIVRYEMLGGPMNEVGLLRWKQSDGHWYVAEGSVHVDRKLRAKWTISEYSADAKRVRSSFALN
ncbi:MAG: hypothetical protein ABL921_35500, partial [Pirellula sp.]